jgi:hypothetical protein
MGSPPWGGGEDADLWGAHSLRRGFAAEATAASVSERDERDRCPTLSRSCVPPRSRETETTCRSMRVGWYPRVSLRGAGAPQRIGGRAGIEAFNATVYEHLPFAYAGYRAVAAHQALGVDEIEVDGNLGEQR